MDGVDSAFVILPRFTCLVGAAQLNTLPMDVASPSGMQFQVRLCPIQTPDPEPPPRIA